MHLQLGMSVAGNAVLIGVALFVLAILPLRSQDWTVAAGMPLGWIALAGSVAAAAHGSWHNEAGDCRPTPWGLLGMTALGLLACTVRWILPALGFGADSAAVGLSHADARLGDLCPVHRAGHVVGGQPGGKR